jgi:hypothetical protein
MLWRFFYIHGCYALIKRFDQLLHIDTVERFSCMGTYISATCLVFGFDRCAAVRIGLQKLQKFRCKKHSCASN